MCSARFLRLAAITFCIALLFSACGGGSGGGGGDPITLYVRAIGGNDGNNGESPGAALQTIATAVTRARAGDTIIVGPGTYRPETGASLVVDITAKEASPDRPLILRADVTGTSTGDPPGEVTVDADGGSFGFQISNASGIIVDGFTVTGATGENAAGIQVRSSSRDVTVRNCHISGNGGDGIRVEASQNTLVFNNLIENNGNRGIQVSGAAADTIGNRLIHNTVADSGNDGISIGGQFVRDAFLRNNIVLNNGQRGIDTDGEATRGYDADYNLVFPTTRDGVPVAYGISTPKGANDLGADPAIVGFFRLSQIAGGQAVDSAAVDAGDDRIDAALRDQLSVRTTAVNDLLDGGRPDLGVHFVSSIVPEPTSTPTTAIPVDTPTTGPGTPQPTFTATPSVDTPTPVITPQIVRTLFVRAEAGDDNNDGATPETALQRIQTAVDLAAAGVEIVVGPGTYLEQVIIDRNGTQGRPIVLTGDASGARTGDAPGDVIVSGQGNGRGIYVDGAQHWTVQGMTITGSTIGIHVRRQAVGTVLRDNVIFDNADDGIRVQDTDGIVVFNNLVFCNGRRGLLLAGPAGSANAQVVNNTVVSNADRGVFIGSSSAPSTGGFLRNNLLQDNCRANLQVVDNSVPGFDAQYNLVSPPTYFGVAVHPTDTAFDQASGNSVDRPAGFVDRPFCQQVCPRPQDPTPPEPTPTPTPFPAVFEQHPNDFRLSQTIAGQDPPDGLGVDAGDPTLASRYRVPLSERTTATNDEPDGGRPDIGYHFPR